MASPPCLGHSYLSLDLGTSISRRAARSFALLIDLNAAASFANKRTFNELSIEWFAKGSAPSESRNFSSLARCDVISGIGN